MHAEGLVCLHSFIYLQSLCSCTAAAMQFCDFILTISLVVLALSANEVIFIFLAVS